MEGKEPDTREQTPCDSLTGGTRRSHTDRGRGWMVGAGGEGPALVFRGDGVPILQDKNRVFWGRALVAAAQVKVPNTAELCL